MATYTETIRTPSQNIISTQGSGIRLDEAQGRLVMFNGAVNRMVIGLDPTTGNIIIAISKPGEDVFEALAA